MIEKNEPISSLRSKNRHTLTLAQYVHHRNGVPLGASGSLQNMLYRSFGAGSFKTFWQYWNPIWGYALGRFIYAPSQRFLPSALALILTFTISGALHDLATTLVRQSEAFFFTPWFFLMGLAIIVEQAFKINHSKFQWKVRASINFTYILACLGLTILILQVV